MHEDFFRERADCRGCRVACTYVVRFALEQLSSKNAPCSLSRQFASRLLVAHGGMYLDGSSIWKATWEEATAVDNCKTSAMQEQLYNVLG